MLAACSHHTRFFRMADLFINNAVTSSGHDDSASQTTRERCAVMNFLLTVRVRQSRDAVGGVRRGSRPKRRSKKTTRPPPAQTQQHVRLRIIRQGSPYSSVKWRPQKLAVIRAAEHCEQCQGSPYKREDIPDLTDAENPHSRSSADQQRQFCQLLQISQDRFARDDAPALARHLRYRSSEINDQLIGVAGAVDELHELTDGIVLQHHRVMSQAGDHRAILCLPAHQPTHFR